MKFYRIVVLAILLQSVCGYAQGIQFDHITFEEALQKAKQENKLVFIDFHTVWCGPCKKMARDVFPLASVGDVYNKNFINLKLDAEKEGKAVAKKYNVTNYPTFLFLDTDGNVLLKDSAYRPEDLFIASANKAVASLTSEYSLENLKEAYPNHQNDEQFLKMYIQKMKEYGQDVTEAVDAWLKVQTEMEETSPEMKAYILRNSRDFFIGGTADAIYNRNYDTYMASATPYEQRMLPRVKTQIVNNTRKVALRNKDAELLKLYVAAYKELEYAKPERILEGELSYYALLKDDEKYKKLTETYIEEFLKKESVQAIQQADQKAYDRYQRAYDKDPTLSRKYMLEASKAGLKAMSISEDLASKGRGYLKRISSKKEYETLNSWIQFGYELKAENCYMDDLKADMYLKKGQTKEALQLKERALKNWPKSDKKLVNKEYELEQLKKGVIN
ncbi:thioredoxin family protein [Formosa haliotis]|uniref:thioredoxin family protein n=1 Tax=Formosa haliotis TaxID=1555194 RepID=UPI000825C2D9|nr:thioredoxin family protein [Formosa haliotis]